MGLNNPNKTKCKSCDDILMWLDGEPAKITKFGYFVSHPHDRPFHKLSASKSVIRIICSSKTLIGGFWGRKLVKRPVGLL